MRLMQRLIANWDRVRMADNPLTGQLGADAWQPPIRVLRWLSASYVKQSCHHLSSAATLTFLLGKEAGSMNNIVLVHGSS